MIACLLDCLLVIAAFAFISLKNLEVFECFDLIVLQERYCSEIFFL